MTACMCANLQPLKTELDSASDSVWDNSNVAEMV